MRMRPWRTTLFASAAALALTAGAGFAQGMQDHGGASGAAGAAEQHGGAAQSPGGANKSMGNEAMGHDAMGHGAMGHDAMGHAGTVDRSGQGTNARAGASTMQKGAQDNQQGANRNAKENRSGNARNAQNKTSVGEEHNARKQNGATTNNRAEQQHREMNRGTAQEPQKSNERNAATQPRGNNNKAAERLERNKRLQGNASGVNVQLNDKQRSEIRTTVIDKRGAPRVGHVDFDVTVGTVVPRAHVHVLPVPETLVRIEPEWRGYLYFVYEDEVVIVNPRDMKIVAVVTV